jgi:hypothetical protein
MKPAFRYELRRSIEWEVYALYDLLEIWAKQYMPECIDYQAAVLNEFIVKRLKTIKIFVI